jgi:hypothetical protein
MKLKNLAALGLAGLIGSASLLPIKADEKTTYEETTYEETIKMFDGMLDASRKRAEQFEESSFFNIYLSDCWQSYSGTKKRKKPYMHISELDLAKSSETISGIRADYFTPYPPEYSYQGIYRSIEFTNLSGHEGIGFWARGNGMIRVELTEGYESDGNAYFGEIYEKIIEPASKWEYYGIPFEGMEKRKDFQHINNQSAEFYWNHCRIAAKEYDNKFDRKQVKDITLEFLRKDIKGVKGLLKKQRSIEIKGMGFYKNKSTGGSHF